MFWNIVIGIASFALNLVLAPKPQNAKPASLEDFNIPVAQEGAEIPVAFGTVYIKSPNVVWYGDLRVQNINGPRRYGFFGPHQITGHRYALGMHMVLCHAVHDTMLEIWAGEKLISPSRLDGSGVMAITQYEIFGGDDGEGGIQGFIDILDGGPGQMQDPYLVTQLAGADTPAFRGVVSVVWESLYIGTTPYIKPWEFKLQRVFQRSNGLEQWYLPKAGIPIGGVSTNDVAFYFAIDVSPSIVGVRMQATKACLHGAVDYLRTHTDHSYDIRLESFADSVVDTLEFRDAAGTDFDDLDDFIDALAATGTGTDFAVGVSDASAFFAGAGSKTRVIIVVSDNADQIGDAISGVAAAVTTISGISGVLVNGFRMWGAGTSTMTDASLEQLDNTAADNHPPGTGGDDNGVGEVPIVHFGDTHGLYSALNPSPTVTSIYYEMNPAHIIRECLTDSLWGMGYADADIDDDAFTAAADTLYSENFGMSLLWTHEEKIEEFISVVLSHIDAYLYLRRTTGKFYLKLIRSDYVTSALPLFDEDDIVSWDEVSRREPAEAVNSVIVKYTDRLNRGRDASLSFDNIAQIQMLGERISATRVYTGVSRGALASQLAARDQRSLGIGMISGHVTGKRTLDVLYPGDPFRLTSARHNLDGEIMRVASLKFGDGRSNQIGLQFLQDVFRLGAADLIDMAQGDWESPVNLPEAVTPRLVWEMPYQQLQHFIGSPNLAALLSADADAGMLEVSGGQPTADSLDAKIYVDGATNNEVMTFAPHGVLDVSVGALEVLLALTDAGGLDLIEAGDLAVVMDDGDWAGAEIVRILSVAGFDLTVDRGMLDTVPRSHVAGAVVIVFGTDAASDNINRTAGADVDVRLLTRTLLGSLAYGSAPDDEVVFDSRAIRPLRPANVQVEGEAEGPVNAVSLSTIEVTLAERNRLAEIGSALPSWTAATVAPEAGQTIVLEILDPTNTTVTTTHAGLGIGDFPYAVPLASFGGNSSGWIRAGAERDGYREWQAYAIETLVGSVGSGVGAAAGTSTVIGISPVQAVGSASGTSTVIGVSASTGNGVGSAAGTSTVIGISASASSSVGSAAGTSTVSGVASAPPIGSFIATAAPHTNNSATYSDTINTGVADANRITVVVVHWELTTTDRAPSNITLDNGGGATNMTLVQTSHAASGNGVAIYQLANTTGTSATIACAGSSDGGVFLAMQFSVYRVVTANPTPVDSGNNAGNPPSVANVEVTAGGFLVCATVCSTNVNLTATYNGVDTPVADVPGTSRLEGGSHAIISWSCSTTENQTTNDAGASGASGRAVAASWGL